MKSVVEQEKNISDLFWKVVGTIINVVIATPFVILFLPIVVTYIIDSKLEERFGSPQLATLIGLFLMVPYWKWLIPIINVYFGW